MAGNTTYLSTVQIVSARPQKPIEIVDYDPTWPDKFKVIAQRVKDALGDKALAINHVGSTSVPGLPAKAVIDIDLVVADPTAEQIYVTALEAAGFQFLFREPDWHEHRFFGSEEPYANLHVFGPGAEELRRHLALGNWLRQHDEDCKRYADVKRQAAAASQVAGETGMQYNARKEAVILDILSRALGTDGTNAS